MKKQPLSQSLSAFFQKLQEKKQKNKYYYLFFL
jgi:hypothetical protein